MDPNHEWFSWEGGRGADPTDWMNHPELLTDGKLRFSFGGFLVRGGALRDRVVLVDCGNGPEGDDFIPPGRLPAVLRTHGVELDDVTDVLLTHLHYDHTGWLASRGMPVFANARVHVASSEVEWFTNPQTLGESAAVTPARLEAVSSHVEIFEGECTPVPGISAIPAPGHTPGSTVFLASAGSTRYIFLGDVVHCPVQLVASEWAVLGDVDAQLAARTRENLAKEMEGALIAGAHFPGLSLGRLLTTSISRTWSVPS